MSSFIRATTLSGKIAMGFSLVLALHLTVAVVGHVGLEYASRDLEELTAGRRFADRIVGIDDEVGRLQRVIQNYTQTGHAAQVERIHRLEQALQEDLTSSALDAPQEDRPALQRMLESLERFDTQFERVVVDRQRHRQLLEVDLRGHGDVLESELRELVARQGDHSNQKLPLAIERAQGKLSEARLSIQRYVSELDPAAVRRAKQSLHEIQTLVEEALPAALHESTSALRVVRETVPQFEQDLTELVQVTRGYLHLVNVVLAGETEEFRYESEQLRTRNLARLDLLTQQIAAGQEDFQKASLWISLVTILMGIFAGSAIGRVVVRPVLAISSTLTELAAGNEQPRIPGVERTDEVGQMARAAEVFRRKNEETDRLLEETQRLAREHEEVITDLERTNAELDNFANVASHDLKAPLRAISSLAEWIEEDLPEQLPEVVKGHLAALRKRTSRMGKLLNDLLTYSKASRSEYSLTELSVKELAEDVWGLIGDPARVEFEVHGQDVTILTPRIPLEQVLGNLFSNAVKHNDRSHGKVDIWIEDQGDFVELRVVDDGPGIAPRHHQRVFEVFRTLKSRDDLEASGIGLALVQRHVERIGGSVEILSPRDRRGCTFIVRWPRLAHSRQTAELPAAAQANTDSNNQEEAQVA